MTVLAEPHGVDRAPLARVIALRPSTGRHAAAGSPETAGLAPTAPVPARRGTASAGGATATVTSLPTSPRPVGTVAAASAPTGHVAVPDTRTGCAVPDGRHREAAHGEVPAARSLVRELEEVAAAMHDHGPLPSLRVDLRQLLSAWAAALVRLHRTPLTAAVPVAELPWVLREPLPRWLGDLPVDVGPVWAARAHPGVARAVEDARRSWSAVQWTHGDPTGDEVVVTRTHGVPRAVLLGVVDRSSPEGPLPAAPSHRSGRGDPRWDVATALDWLALALGPALDPGWELDPVATFVAEYRELGGDALPTRSTAVARTLCSAVEWTAQLTLGAEPTDEERAWLVGLWQRPLELVARTRPSSPATRSS